MSAFRRRRASAVTLACLSALAAARPAAADYQTDTWLNPAAPSGNQRETRLWLNPANWSLGVVPNDTAATNYDANISSGVQVYLQSQLPTFPATPQTTFDLNLGSSSTLYVSSPLTVADAVSAPQGAIVVSGTSFLAPTQPATAAPIQTLTVQNGGTAAIDTTALDFSNVGGGNYTADGPGSLFDLHTVRTLTFGGGNYNAVTATNGGTVDLSGLTAVRRSVYYSHLTFTAAGGGTLKLPNLQTVNVDSAGSNGQQVYFTLGPGPASVSLRL